MPDGARRGAGRRAARGVCVCRVHARVEPWTPSARRPRLRAPRACAPSALMNPRMGARRRAPASAEGLLTRTPPACSRERKMTPVRASASSGWRTAPARRPGRLAPARQPRQCPHLRLHLRLRLRLHLDLHLPHSAAWRLFFRPPERCATRTAAHPPPSKNAEKSARGSAPVIRAVLLGPPPIITKARFGAAEFRDAAPHGARAGGWCGAVCVWGGVRGCCSCSCGPAGRRWGRRGYQGGASGGRRGAARRGAPRG